MAPPSYSDLGKAARDIFSKGYNYGFYKLECKTKTDSGVKFTTSGSSSSETGKITGNLETEYKWSDYGITVKEKWSTDNVLATELSIEDQIAEGLKLAFDAKFTPQTGKKNGKVKVGYKMDYVNTNCDVDFDFAGPTVNGAAVLGYNGWLAGCEMAFDTSKSKLTKSNFAVGYAAGDLTLHTYVNDGSEFGGSFHHKCNSDIENSVNLSWTAGSNATIFAVGSKYKLGKDASINAKVNNSGQVGLGYTQEVRDGVKMTLSTLLDGKNFNAGGHKVGVGLEFEA